MVAALARNLVQQCHDVRWCELETLALFGEALGLSNCRHCTAGRARASTGAPATTCMADLGSRLVRRRSPPRSPAGLRTSALHQQAPHKHGTRPAGERAAGRGAALRLVARAWTCRAGARFAASPAQGRHCTGKAFRMGRPRRFQLYRLVMLPLSWYGCLQLPHGGLPLPLSRPHMHQPLPRRPPTQAQVAC